MPVPFVIGPAQFTVFPIVPGRTGEPRRLRAELSALDPTAIAIETDLRHVIGMKRAASTGRRLGRDEPFLPRLLRREVARLFRGEDVDPLRAAFDHARERNVTLVPLLSEATRPGLLWRWQMTREARAIEAGDEEDYAKRFWRHVAHREETRHAAYDSGEHLADVLYRDGHPRIAVVAHAAHVDAIVKQVRARAPHRPATEATRETATLAEDPQKRYPQWR